jgi:hypothetical protein
MEDGSINYISVTAGMVQTLLYADFFYYFVMSKLKGIKTVTIPI